MCSVDFVKKRSRHETTVKLVIRTFRDLPVFVDKRRYDTACACP